MPEKFESKFEQKEPALFFEKGPLFDAEKELSAEDKIALEGALQDMLRFWSNYAERQNDIKEYRGFFMAADNFQKILPKRLENMQFNIPHLKELLPISNEKVSGLASEILKLDLQALKGALSEKAITEERRDYENLSEEEYGQILDEKHEELFGEDPLSGSFNDAIDSLSGVKSLYPDKFSELVEDDKTWLWSNLEKRLGKLLSSDNPGVIAIDFLPEASKLKEIFPEEFDRFFRKNYDEIFSKTQGAASEAFLDITPGMKKELEYWQPMTDEDLQEYVEIWLEDVKEMEEKRKSGDYRTKKLTKPLKPKEVFGYGNITVFLKELEPVRTLFPDKKFSEYYSKSSIFVAAVFK
jgi:hypothetical protein